MNLSIQFNRQHQLKAKKVNDIFSNGVLSSEFITTYLTLPKYFPQSCFGSCTVIAQMFSDWLEEPAIVEFYFFFKVNDLRLLYQSPPPHPSVDGYPPPGRRGIFRATNYLLISNIATGQI